MSIKEGVQLKKEKYTVQVNYSPEATEKKLMKFITKPSGDEFEISADEMMTMLVGQVNSETLEAISVETAKINVVDVTRQMLVVADRDIKQGEEIRINYTHPYPIEFALIEEGMKLAKINQDVPMYELTPDYIMKARLAITPKQHKFVEHFYKFLKTLKTKAGFSA